MARFVVQPEADQDILQILRYIARDNETAAIKFYDSLRSTFSLLASQPFMG
jgi:plasmid stabilization system protein ParE